jgi:hypothetical protein
VSAAPPPTPASQDRACWGPGGARLLFLLFQGLPTPTSQHQACWGPQCALGSVIPAPPALGRRRGGSRAVKGLTTVCPECRRLARGGVKRRVSGSRAAKSGSSLKFPQSAWVLRSLSGSFGSRPNARKPRAPGTPFSSLLRRSESLKMTVVGGVSDTRVQARNKCARSNASG